MPTRAASRRALGSQSSAQGAQFPDAHGAACGEALAADAGKVAGARLFFGADQAELPAFGEDTAHGGHVEVGGGGGIGGGEVGAECGHLGVANLVPRECPEGMPSGGEGLGDSAEDAADGLAGV